MSITQASVARSSPRNLCWDAADHAALNLNLRLPVYCRTNLFESSFSEAFALGSFTEGDEHLLIQHYSETFAHKKNSEKDRNHNWSAKIGGWVPV